MHIDEIDAAVLDLAGTILFESARYRDTPGAVRVAIPVSFPVGG